MHAPHADLLNSERALIFRIIHRANLDWVLQHGLHCGNATVRSPHWVSIGSQELIAKRTHWPVSVPPGGSLNDYVPFYFTPFSPMMLNILTGYNGVPLHRPQDIVFLVTSLRRIATMGLVWLFTDSHANNRLVKYFRSLDDLSCLDWKILQASDFRHDPEDPAKRARYQAEALIHRHCPVQGLSGIACFDEDGKIAIGQAVRELGLSMPVIKQPSWYFRKSR